MTLFKHPEYPLSSVSYFRRTQISSTPISAWNTLACSCVEALLDMQITDIIPFSAAVQIQTAIHSSWPAKVLLQDSQLSRGPHHDAYGCIQLSVNSTNCLGTYMPFSLDKHLHQVLQPLRQACKLGVTVWDWTSNPEFEAVLQDDFEDTSSLSASL